MSAASGSAAAAAAAVSASNAAVSAASAAAVSASAAVSAAAVSAAATATAAAATGMGWVGWSQWFLDGWLGFLDWWLGFLDWSLLSLWLLWLWLWSPWCLAASAINLCLVEFCISVSSIIYAASFSSPAPVNAALTAATVAGGTAPRKPNLFSFNVFATSIQFWYHSVKFSGLPEQCVFTSHVAASQEHPLNWKLSALASKACILTGIVRHCLRVLLTNSRSGAYHS